MGILLVGGIDSFGVPYTRDNKNNKSHLDEVYNFLIKQGIQVKKIDMYSMHKYNDTDYMDYLLSSRIDLYKIRKNQIESIDLCRKSGLFQFIQLPKKTKQLYILNDFDKDKIFIDMIKKYNDVIFVYSCGVNDFLKNMDTNLSRLLKPKNMKKAFNDLEKNISLIMDKIEDNVKKMIKINKNIEIYIMGLYIPTRVRYIRDTVKQPIILYNSKLQELCKMYKNVYYIDNTNLSKNHMAHVDWHPNYCGQRLMGKNIISNIKHNSKILQKKKRY